MSNILTIEEYQKQTKSKLIRGRNQKVFDDENIVINDLDDFFYIANINDVNHILCDYFYYDKEDYQSIDEDFETRPFGLFLSFILNNFVYTVIVEDNWLENEEIGEKDIIEKELRLLLKELSVDENFMINGTNKHYRSKIARDMIDDNKDKYTLLSDQCKRKEHIDFQYEIDNLYNEERLHYRKL